MATTIMVGGNRPEIGPEKTNDPTQTVDRPSHNRAHDVNATGEVADTNWWTTALLRRSWVTLPRWWTNHAGYNRSDAPQDNASKFLTCFRPDNSL